MFQADFAAPQQPPEHLRILLLEDVPLDADVIAATLSSGGIDCELHRVATRAAFVTALEIEPIDLILADYLLPDFDGLTALSLARARHPDLPFILLSGSSGEELAIESLKLGATDYVLKQRLERLVPCVQRAVREVQEHRNRQQAEAELRESEQLLRLALSGAQAGSWHWNLETGESIWSLESYQLYGIDPANGVPSYAAWYNQCLHPDDRPWLNDYIAQVVEQRQTNIPFEFRILHPEKGVRWLLGLGQLSLDPQGQPVRMSGISLDITERKQAELKIRQQAALLEIASDAIFVRDLEHRILYWNQGAVRLYGWTAEEAKGQVAYELLQSETRLLPTILSALLSDGEWQGDIIKVTKAGQTVSVATRWTLVRDEAHQPKFILSVDTDITEKKQFEMQFYRAQRLESLGTLASGIAHDLNNVFTPILGIAQLLQLHQRDSGLQEMLQILESSAKRGANLVKQILTFARGMGGQPMPLQVAALAHEVVKVIQQTFPKSITIRTNIPHESLWLVSADPIHLHQVLINLCVNARDAMPKGGLLTLSVENVEVDATLTPTLLEAQTGAYVAFTVTDTGCGISAEIRDRMFEPFFTTKAMGQGTGLGLSTVLGIVRSYGGFIQVQSQPGAGSQFQIYLPALETALPFAEPSASLPMGQGELILVVDDEPDVLQATQAILEAYQYQVLTALNSDEAIAYYSQYSNEINLVMVDVMMPGTDGLMTIRRLREINAQIRIVATSGLTDDYRQSLQEMGITTLLPKPFMTRELIRTVGTSMRA